LAMLVKKVCGSAGAPGMAARTRSLRK
jgi:hypothetical protein